MTTTPKTLMRLAAASTVLAALPWFVGCTDPAQAMVGGQGPAPVSVAPAVQRNDTDNEEFSGRLEAAEFVELRPLAAEVARLESQLLAARLRAELASTELARAQKLLDSAAISKQEFDQLTSSSHISKADILAAEASLRSARLNLEFTTVRAPITGRVSRANVTAGNLVNEQVTLTTIAGVARVHAYFDGSEQTFLRARGIGGQAPAVLMGLANEEGHPHSGKLDFIDNRLNPQTGAIRLRASFDNAKGQFMPGMAVRIVMATSSPYTALMVPERARRPAG